MINSHEGSSRIKHIFNTRMSREVLGAILTAFFQKTGYISPGMTLELKTIESDGDDIHISGEVTEEPVN